MAGSKTGAEVSRQLSCKPGGMEAFNSIRKSLYLGIFL